MNKTEISNKLINLITETYGVTEHRAMIFIEKILFDPDFIEDVKAAIEKAFPTRKRKWNGTTLSSQK